MQKKPFGFHENTRLNEDVEIENCNKDPRVMKLYCSYIPELSEGIRIRYGDGPPDPDDVAQETFRRIFEKPDTSDVQNIKAFIWRIARNFILSEKKREETHAKYSFDVALSDITPSDSRATPENIALAKQQLNAVNEILLKMPDKRRRAIMLYRVEGLTLEEVGRKLGISRRAVSKHISRAHLELSPLFIDDIGD